MTTASPHSVAVVAYERIGPFHLAVPCMVFGEEVARLGVAGYSLTVCAAEPAPLRTSAGFTVDGLCGIEAIGAADTVIVPAWRDALERAPQVLLDALAKAGARGARVVGLCLGAFVLGDAGLLDGRRASTHWLWLEEFSRRFPKVTLDPDKLYVHSDNLVTSAGTAAAIDCCLDLVRSDYGAQIANRVARRLVVAPHRNGGQAQYYEPVSVFAGVDRLADTIAWALERLEQPLTIDSLASRALMSRRTFTRHFAKTTGTTFQQWLLNQRLARVQELLETTDGSLEQIAGASGFGSVVSLRQHFFSRFSVTPRQYRRTFAGTSRLR